MRIEVFAAQAKHLLQARLVGTDGGHRIVLGKLRFEDRPQRAVAVLAHARCQAVIAEGPASLFGHQTGIFQQAEVARDTGLRQAENPSQLGHVEAILSQHTQETEPRLIAEQPEEGGRLLHIY